MSQDVYRSIRISPYEVQSLLRELNARARGAPVGPNPKREHARMEYQVGDVLIAIKHPGKTVARYLVTSRNLSAGGMAFLHGGYLHTGTTCFVLLTDVHGAHVKLVGTVRACRHVSKSLHEVGLEFLEKIDPQRFCGEEARITSNDPDLIEIALPNLSGQGLFVSESGDQRRSATSRLSATGMTVLGVGSVGDASDKLRQVGFDVVILDGAPTPSASPADAIGQVRAAGYDGPIVFVAQEGREPEAGATGEVAAVLHQPVRAETLIWAVAGLVEEFGGGGSSRAVHSLLGGRPGMGDAIARFVGNAHSARKELLDALDRGQFERIRELCTALRRDGSQSGFAVVGEAARRTLGLLASLGEEPEGEVEASVRFLAGLCERLREGGPETEEEAGDAAELDRAA